MHLFVIAKQAITHFPELRVDIGSEHVLSWSSTRSQHAQILSKTAAKVQDRGTLLHPRKHVWIAREVWNPGYQELPLTNAWILPQAPGFFTLKVRQLNYELGGGTNSQEKDQINKSTTVKSLLAGETNNEAVQWNIDGSQARLQSVHCKPRRTF
jgi:hypothetical protein